MGTDGLDSKHDRRCVLIGLNEEHTFCCLNEEDEKAEVPAATEAGELLERPEPIFPTEVIEDESAGM